MPEARSILAALGRRLADRAAWRDALGWAWSCLQLQLGRQLTVLGVLDAVLVGFGVLTAMTAEGSPAAILYTSGGLVPLLVLGVPALADLVALERRAGCLDLALAAPAGELYFLRRLGVVVAALLAQGVGLLVVAWLLTDGEFPLLTAVAQLAAVTLFVAAVTLFWAVRLGSAGSVWLASMVTVAAAGKWLFWTPVVTALPGGPRIGKLLPNPWGIWEWATRFTPLVVATLLLLSYARRRLQRPETLLRAAS
jgi:hypothetical protein